MDRRTFLRTSGLSATALGGVAAGSATAAAGPRTMDKPLRVQLLMFDGVEEQDFAGPLEVLALASKLGEPVTMTMVTADRPGRIRASFGTEIAVGNGWSPGDADLLVVPGGGYTNPDGPGVHQVIKQQRTLAALAAAHASGVLMTALCTGVMVLSAAGLTKGRPCTTHRGARADLAAQGGKLVDARVVDDGDLVTSGGITSGLDLALWLLERELGAATAVKVENILEYERRGSVWRPN
ncbi:DJ-1/PfpI family protein [Amycolatopsis nigrescens]|uniref:DJ-1/PfpI family protein n=1 Tax=Amycolatopsis nigrescens TaxID=381445 RepID=UPI00035DE045|nr:DJ-1/PfpI family protein [Amycolatopsis nigrescens]